MYGLVNKAVEGLVVRDHGEAIWQQIKQRAACDVDVFVGTHAYDDAVTYSLVGAAADVLRLSPRDILHAFGEYWVLEIAARQYRHMLVGTGDRLRDFLVQLPTFHARVMLVLPKLVPPTFTISDETEAALTLHYRSGRRGLQDFVVGVLRGLGRYYHTEIRVEHLANVDEGADHDQFRVSWA